jgi:2-iminobutanoate/2-iminopropanoate deaminase
MKNVLEAGGSSFQKVVKVTIFLRDMADFVPVNQLYATCKSRRY